MTLYEQRLAEDLQIIRNAVKDIAERVGTAFEKTVSAIIEGDRETLHEVVLDDLSINRDVRELDRLCHEFVARHYPAAGHLRFISSVLRITIALERAGDYAVTISRVFLQLSQPLSRTLIDKIRDMAELSVSMLSDAVRAMLSGNVELANTTRQQDYRIDRAYDEIFSDLVQEGKDRDPLELMVLLRIFSKMERFSDQAKNICEEAIFAATGEMKQPKVFRILFVDAHNDLVSPLAAAIAHKSFPNSGIYSSAGWKPAKEMHPALAQAVDRFGLELSNKRPVKVSGFVGFPTVYHLVVAIGLSDDSLLPPIPYHTILVKWDLPLSEYLSEAIPEGKLNELVRVLTHRIGILVEKLRGKDAD